MIVLPPPFEAFTDASAPGWTETQENTWIHANGLRLSVSPHAFFRLVDFKLNAVEIRLQLLPSDDSGLESLLHDTQAWIQGLDLAPRRRITHRVAAWLAAHGKTGDYQFELRDPRQNRLSVDPAGMAEGMMSHILVPKAILGDMKADLQEFWTRTPSPTIGHQHLVVAPSRARTAEPRYWTVRLPETQHARLHLVASLPPHLRRIRVPTSWA